jgi:hypothetical protein
VQGRLRRRKLAVLIDSECGHCGGPLRMTVDQDLRWRVDTPGAQPLLFEPSIDWGTFRGKNIIDVY